MRLIFDELIKQFSDKKGTIILFIMPFIVITIVGSLIVGMDPRKLPTAVIMKDSSPIIRSYITSIHQSRDHSVDYILYSEKEGRRLLQQGKIAYLITIPAHFSHDLIRGDNPQINIEIDATVTTKALTLNSAIKVLAQKEFIGPLHYLNDLKSPFSLNVHELYNPEALSQYKIIPGLIGVMFLVVGILLNQIVFINKANHAPIPPSSNYSIFLMTASKVFPFLLIQGIQAFLLLLLLIFIYDIPINGHFLIFTLGLSLYSCCNILLAFTFSLGAKSPILALPSFALIFIPSFIMSGFLFPFYGMPKWAQQFAEILPLRHFIQISRGILVKGSTFNELLPHILPLAFMVMILFLVASLRNKMYLKSLHKLSMVN